MDIFIIALLRLVHIFGGILWAGWAFMNLGFVEPALRAAGPEGGKFMQMLTGKTKFVQTMVAAPLLVVLTGLLMYWGASNGLSGAWIVSGEGLALTIGGLAGVLAFLYGLVILFPINRRLAAMSGGMQSPGGRPNPEQIAELQALQQQLSKGGLYMALLLAVSVVGMSVAAALG